MLAKTFLQGTAGKSAGQDLPAGDSREKCWPRPSCREQHREQQGKVLAKAFLQGTSGKSAGQDLPAGNSTGSREKRQAKEEMGKHVRVDMSDSEWSNQKHRQPRRLEEAGCQI